MAWRGLAWRRLGLAARRLGWRLGRRLLELQRLGLGRWLGLGLGSGLGDCGGDRARRGRDRFTASLWRRSGLLGQAACLDSERPLYGPAAGERLLLSQKAAASASGKEELTINAEAAILNVCSASTVNIHSGMSW